jgi:hypothetical protein
MSSAALAQLMCFIHHCQSEKLARRRYLTGLWAEGLLEVLVAIVEVSKWHIDQWAQLCCCRSGRLAEALRQSANHEPP